MEKTNKLIEKLKENWEKARSLQNIDCAKRKSWEKNFTTINGDFPWNNGSLVMLCNFVEYSGYEEYGSIIGLSKDGGLMWEYQSHCSCSGFEDSSDEGNELKHEHVLEKKTFELEYIPVDYEEKIKDSIEKLLVAIKK